MSANAPSWPWQRLNEGNVSAHDVLATLLHPQPGERWLEVGTGAPAHSPQPWEEAVRSFASLRGLVERLGEDEVAALRGELEALAERFRDRPLSYVVALGRRR